MELKTLQAQYLDLYEKVPPNRYSRDTKWLTQKIKEFKEESPKFDPFTGSAKYKNMYAAVDLYNDTDMKKKIELMEKLSGEVSTLGRTKGSATNACKGADKALTASYNKRKAIELTYAKFVQDNKEYKELDSAVVNLLKQKVDLNAYLTPLFNTMKAYDEVKTKKRAQEAALQKVEDISATTERNNEEIKKLQLGYDDWFAQKKAVSDQVTGSFKGEARATMRRAASNPGIYSSIFGGSQEADHEAEDDTQEFVASVSPPSATSSLFGGLGKTRSRTAKKLVQFQD